MSRKSFLFSASVVMCMAFRSALAATPGYVEDFNDDVLFWFSGSSLSHETTGGVGGAGDGWLSVSTSFPANLGAASNDPNFLGDLVADGVTGFSFWLRDTGQDDDLEIHLGLGTPFNSFWFYTVGFAPAEDAWTQYIVDFSNPALWVRTQGTGTFAEALAASDRLLFRHDNAPYVHPPDQIQGDFGLDRITVLPEPGTLTLLVLGGAALIRRRQA